jgi:Flp pilus assembly protein TadD
MNTHEALGEFRRGVELLRKHYPGNALGYLRRAVELDRSNPFYMSFLGVAVARAQGKWGEAEFLCATAVQLKGDDARLYLNLAEVYIEANRRQDAIRVLQTGMERTANSSILLKAMGRMQRRRPPILTFLGRSHFLNRHLGRLRHALIEFCHEHWQTH